MINNKDDADQNEGYVWVIDGKVQVKNQNSKGMPPLLNPCQGVKLIINGIEQNHLVFVSEQDHIELIPINEETELKVEVEISEDKLSAYMNFEPPGIVKRIIKDTYPINKLDIEVIETKDNVEICTKEQVLEKIRTQGVVFGLKENVIEGICHNGKKGRYLIAEGKSVTNPIDDTLECHFPEESFEEIIKEDQLGNIDYKNSVNYVGVKPGDVIATLHKGTPGEKGMSVLGEEILPEEPKQILIASSRSIIYTEEDGMIRAKKSGRPVRTQKGNVASFEIREELVLKEVNIKTGNVNFLGDVQVAGSVSESMEVIATNNVLVKGDLTFSSIIAGNDITVKGNTVSSKIIAGDRNIAAKDPNIEMQKIINEIRKLIANIESMSNSELLSNNLEKFPDIVNYLLNTKNRALPSTIYEVIRKLQKENYSIDESTLLQVIEQCKCFLGNYNVILDINYLKQLVEYLKSIFYISEEETISGNAYLNCVLNSEITALGNVSLIGKISFNTRIFAKGKIIISGSIRSGEVRSDKYIEINTVGTEMGTKTILYVPENGVIKVKHIYPDTTIIIGRSSYKFLNKQRSVYARLINGKIAF